MFAINIDATGENVEQVNAVVSSIIATHKEFLEGWPAQTHRCTLLVEFVGTPEQALHLSVYLGQLGFAVHQQHYEDADHHFVVMGLTLHEEIPF